MGSKRQEFPAAVKRAALERSGGRCEAVGERYGLQRGERCRRTIAPGRVHFDHWPRPARDPHPDTRTLGNCWATCPQCNMRANNLVDTPREAKIKAVSYRHGVHAARMARKAGLDVPDPPRPREKKHKPKPIRSRGFEKPKAGRPFPRRANHAQGSQRRPLRRGNQRRQRPQ